MYDPFEELRRFHKSMEKFQKEVKNQFKPFFEEKKLLPSTLKAVKEPSCDVSEKKDKIIAKIDLPGVEKKDIQLNITENYAEVKAGKKEEAKTEKKGIFRHERSFRGYYRVVPFPTKIKAEKAKAEYKNGVLEIEAPKEKIKKIEIKKIKIK